mgnify:CR=1 FL=1
MCPSHSASQTLLAMLSVTLAMVQNFRLVTMALVLIALLQLGVIPLTVYAMFMFKVGFLRA